MALVASGLMNAQSFPSVKSPSKCSAAKPSVTAVFNFTPLIAGTAILASWIIVVVLLLAIDLATVLIGWLVIGGAVVVRLPSAGGVHSPNIV